MIKVPKVITIDAETKRIWPRPAYPPYPVGVSIKYPGKKSKYYAWGHPIGNNCTEAAGFAALFAAYEDAGIPLTKEQKKKAAAHKGPRKAVGEGVLFHNCKFDAEVFEKHAGAPLPPPALCHDTLFLLFLFNPHEKDLMLKPAAERHLGLPPEEQDAVAAWLLENQPLKAQGIIMGIGREANHPVGAYISEAPGKLVGAYARGDTDRTEALFKYLYADIVERGMLHAYDVERRLMPVFLAAEKEGVTIAVERVREDICRFEKAVEVVEAWIKKRIKAPNTINLNSGAQVLAALDAAGMVDRSRLLKTEKGNDSSARESLECAITDTQLLGMFVYKSKMDKCLSTYLKPWLEVADKSGGKIFTTWNQTRKEKSGGTRTGRISSHPNLQNIPRPFKPLFKHQVADRKVKATLPTCPVDIPDLPTMRCYIVPPKGYVLYGRDYSQQEPRILAHLVGGELLAAYLLDPWTDLHDFAKALLEERGRFYERGQVKTVNLGLMYGEGINALARDLGISKAEAKVLKSAVESLYPGLVEMYKEMARRARCGEPFTTWAGRVYYCEPSRRSKTGRMQTFEYKMVNAVIQGSAADCTKQALLNWAESLAADPTTSAKFLLQVHDELIGMCKKKDLHKEMKRLKEAMESVEFDVPMLTEGKWSAVSWADFKDYDKKGKRV